MRTYFYVLFFPMLVVTGCKNQQMEHALAEIKLELSETEKLVQSNNLALEASQKRILLYEETAQNLVQASNDDFTLHIDDTDDGQLRFLLWKHPVNTSALPQLALYGGKVKKTGNWGVRQYIFDEKEQRFIVEMVPVRRRSKQYHIFLERLDNGTPKYYGKMTDLKTSPRKDL